MKIANRYSVIKYLLSQKSKEELQQIQLSVNKKFHDASYTYRTKLAVISVLIDEILND